jgi:hypothetical protein
MIDWGVWSEWGGVCDSNDSTEAQNDLDKQHFLGILKLNQNEGRVLAFYTAWLICETDMENGNAEGNLIQEHVRI